ncbi:hypothetical protein RHMOL_Rhmol06G0250300 [Rhododendron molle]|uniref:Uncharacterized protein n=1 Tax=Rhododendron molle TaxID=49168 RepID=A0ACC0NG49_RHOML|nr:hypothetical protein RHMOL_Rhmol06G0250300 [Rhododendron molle]
MHKELLRAFFLNARGMLNQGGEVHVSHREDYPYSTWGLENLAAKSGFNLEEKVRFKKWDYPGYQNVRGGDINCDKPFPLNSHCFTYKFRVDEKYDDQPQRNDHDDADLMAFRHWVMQRLQNSDTHGLQEFAKNKFSPSRR